jgi:hypothetical protein
VNAPDPLDRPDPSEAPRTLKRSDLDLLRQAGRRGWNVPDVLRSEAIYQVAEILSRGSYREKLNAGKLLAAFDRADQVDEKLALDRARFDHATKPPEAPADDYVIDLSDDAEAEAEGDPP